MYVVRCHGIKSCDACEDGKLFEEQGDKVLGLLGGEGNEFFSKLPI